MTDPRVAELEARVATLTEEVDMTQAEWEKAQERFHTAVRQGARWRARADAAEREAATLREALADLVRLKDGPRDDAYRAEKDAAWERARAALAGAGRSTEGEG